jgi:hypothetical protein
MTEIVSKLGDHGIHLILQMKLLLFEMDLLEVIMLRQTVAAVKLLEASFILSMFLDQTAKFRTRGNQVFLDLLLLHHHHAPPFRMETLILVPS